MTIDVFKTRIKAHQRNIERYRQFLPMKLSATEREFVTQRIGQEKAAIKRLKDELQQARGSDPFGACPRQPMQPVGSRVSGDLVSKVSDR